MDQQKLKSLADEYLREANRDYREQLAREMVAIIRNDPTIATKLGDPNPSNVKVIEARGAKFAAVPGYAATLAQPATLWVVDTLE